MSVRASMPVMPSRAARQPGGRPDRLWPALSRPPIRRMPPKGLDLAGEWMVGLAMRWRFRHGLKARAVAIVNASKSFDSHSEGALDLAIDEARAAVIMGREDERVIDHAFSIIHQAVRRTTGLSLYVEQVMGALAIANGCCAEMATGEGKTLTAILPAALDGWTGRGVHVITVNDYLANRDAELTTPSYRRLGLSVGVVVDATESADRREAYARDVTYAADKQVIFDLLRDRLVSPLRTTMVRHLLDHLAGESPEGVRSGDTPWSDRVVLRGLHAAIIDEADSVLIDEAVTPAIIALPPTAGSVWSGEEHFRIAARVARDMEKGADYVVIERQHRVDLTKAGRDRLDVLARDLPVFWSGPRRREELVTQALMAKELYRIQDDYIIRDGKIVIVDRSTGRVLDGRQWQLGLHQSVEAKEGLEVTDANQTSARISYQRFFQRYARLGGMTGTGWETRHELWRDYRLPVVRIPTHRPIARKRLPDRVFDTEDQKFVAVADRVREFHKDGRPVLVGTRSVEASEKLGALLTERGIPCRILNATREAEEAQIVAHAGKLNAVTVATNMAGRGTDIILEPRTRELGGLVVLATERHDEQRVDRQLFGRAGRQGDPGLAQAFVSLDDPLIVRCALPPLTLLARRTHSWVRGPLTKLLWWSAQHAASKRSATLRREVAKTDAWMDLAMANETR